jgi:hypothetical protein
VEAGALHARLWWRLVPCAWCMRVFVLVHVCGAGLRAGVHARGDIPSSAHTHTHTLPLVRGPRVHAHHAAVRACCAPPRPFSCACVRTPWSRFGGACTAAAFLQSFVEPGVAWAHVDIAGTAMASKARGDQPEGGTGFGVRLLADLLPRLAQGPAKA